MLPKELLEDDEIGPAMQEFQKAIADPNIRNLIEMREKAQRDEVSRLAFSYDKGKTEGKMEGRQDGMRQTLYAIQLLSENKYSNNEIAQICGFSIEEVEKIIQGIKGN